MPIPYAPIGADIHYNVNDRQIISATRPDRIYICRQYEEGDYWFPVAYFWVCEFCQGDHPSNDHNDDPLPDDWEDR